MNWCRSLFSPDGVVCIALASQDIQGSTCLHLAAKLGHDDVVQLLLTKAAKYINCQVDTHSTLRTQDRIFTLTTFELLSVMSNSRRMQW